MIIVYLKIIYFQKYVLGYRDVIKLIKNIKKDQIAGKDTYNDL